MTGHVKYMHVERFGTPEVDGIEVGGGPGEGVVLKQYGFVNRYGRTVWAKLVRNEFKERNREAFGVPEKGGTFQVEVAIAEMAVNPALVAKERAKIEGAILAEQHHPPRTPMTQDESDLMRRKALHRARGKLIPRLLETVYHCVCVEELWPALRKFKDPTVVARTKEFAPDLF